MSLKFVFTLLALSGIAGITLGYVLRWLIALGQRGSLELDIKQRILETKERVALILADAKKRSEEIEREKLSIVAKREEKVGSVEERLSKKELFLDEREHDLVDKSEDVRKREQEVTRSKKELDTIIEKQRVALADISHLTQDAAKEQLFAEMERDHEKSLLGRLQKLDALGKERLEEEGRNILLSAIQRMGNTMSPDIMSLSVSIDMNEIKGKIIGKEGRNIRAFERVTGVDVIIDDTPNHITLSSFDPLRRHIAKIALEKLIASGRIQPAKIEEVVEKTRKEVDEIIKQKGELAAYETGVTGLHPKLILLLGRLYFRSSYGQNVLTHSVEMAHIANMLARELGADPEVAVAGALLHDIGKALDHEVEGTHVEIGRRVLERFGVDERVIQAMQSHHEEYPYETIESVIVQVADSVSAGRPGARRDTVERYLKRLGDLEQLAGNFPGVEKVYAVQAGREIRVFVNPGKVSDLSMHKMARSIAHSIQEELKYPGEIKVNVIRENRVVEFAK
ncbi:MAG TPA: ribonuclease Y [Candidatus Kaiserbacteria bacterium]|nr:ribonuclease Y [Candidatus Kaiserbacteria bacterium]